MPNNPHSWLDKIIEDQARYYGMTVEEFKKHSDAICDLQEQSEFHQWEA